ncbi:MAG: hypothetical protein AAF717_08365 [Bacteroidota bacterium]
MRKFYALSVLVLSTACATFTGGKKVTTTIPCIGAIGTTHASFFSKAFVKVGAPELSAPIAVQIQSIAFDRSTFTAYKKFRTAQGKEVTLEYVDTLDTKPRFFQLALSNVVQFTEQLNTERNRSLRTYIMQDRQHLLLSGVSFVTDEATALQLQKSVHFYLTSNAGELQLQGKTGKYKTTIPMAALQVFDFNTSGFCWQNNRYGKPEIALIVPKGAGCPPDLEKDASKIDDTKVYLKLQP